MNDPSERRTGGVDETARTERRIGTYAGNAPGPTTILIGGVHGNEPRGVEGIRTVLEWLDRTQPAMRGRVVGLIGNLRALRFGIRLIDADLNRCFVYHRGDPPRLRPGAKPGDVEVREVHELVAELRTIIARRDPGHEVVVVDLHTFSSHGPPFAVFSDTLRNRAFASAWPIPNVLGLVEYLPGTLADFLTAAGCISVVIETGQHEDPLSADLHAAAIRLALVRAGHLAEDELPSLAEDRRLLARASTGIPRVMDVQVRHGLRSGHRFVMRPGYATFHPVEAGEHLADDEHGRVLAERGGRILLPLYQRQGNDGYFIARPISRWWLRASALLRRLGLSTLLPKILPGVSAHPKRPHVLRADRRIARYLARDVFHLLGYHYLAREGEMLLFSRQPHDRRRPRSIVL